MADLDIPAQAESVERPAHVVWTVSNTSYLRNLDRDDLRAPCVAVHYQSPPIRNDNGTTSISLCFPTLIVSAYCADAQAVADRVAAILNKHWDDEA